MESPGSSPVVDGSSRGRPFLAAYLVSTAVVAAVLWGLTRSVIPVAWASGTSIALLLLQLRSSSQPGVLRAAMVPTLVGAVYGVAWWGYLRWPVVGVWLGALVVVAVSFVAGLAIRRRS